MGKGNDGTECPAAQELCTNATAGRTFGDGRRHEQHGAGAGREVGQAVLYPGELGFALGRHAVRPSLIVGKLVVPPRADAVRRVAKHAVNEETRKGVGAQAVSRSYGDAGSRPAQAEPDCGLGGLTGEDVLAVHFRCARADGCCQ